MRMLFEMSQCFFFAALLGSLALAVVVYAQDQSGFISLDCGLPKDSNYTERMTSINYISDAAFIDTGISKRVLTQYKIDMQQQMWYVRSFPDGIRNCYKFNLTEGSKYLIRANFMYGNYDELDQLPAFDLHIGPNKWESVTFESASLDVVKEIIHVLPSSYLYVCLVNTGSGTPFISALEIRPMNNSIYTPQSGSLNLHLRYDISSTNEYVVRYPDDVYDRMWIPFQYDNCTELSTPLTVDSDNNNNYQPPSLVMRTAGTPTNASASFDIYWEDDASLEFYVYMHFAEVQELRANESRQLNISLNGEEGFGPFSPEYLWSNTVYTPTAMGGGSFLFSIFKTENSTLPPILNALEIYTVKEFLQRQTDQNDVVAVTNIKSIYGVSKNWQGDPCGPPAYLWDGLNCSNGNSDPPRIISLNLSSNGLTGEITTYLSNITLLQYLDLSNNNLTGAVPDFLSQLPLKVLNLEGNKLTGSVPVGLIERSMNGSLLLSVGGNPSLYCSSALGNKKKKKSLVVPVVASASASVVLIAAALVIGLIFKRRRLQGGKLETTNNNTESFESNSQFESKNRQFSYSEVLKITTNFERILGRGGFGTVYHGRLDEMEVAVKMLSPSSVQGFQQFQAEVKLLMRVHHRNLVSLVGYCNENKKTALIYEYMANGNLREHLSESSKNALSWKARLGIAVEAAQGLEYLHNGCKPAIVHRDVKSTNILLNENFQAKLADFGLSKSFPTDGNTHVSTVVAGTPGYLDPDYYTSNRLSEKSDVYSFGVVLLEMITGKPAIFTRINNAYENTHISEWVSSLLSKGDIKNIVDPWLQGAFDTNSVWKALEIAMACLSSSANKRPTMNVVVTELNECLATEMARTRTGSSNYRFNSTERINRVMTMNLGTEINPSAR